MTDSTHHSFNSHSENFCRASLLQMMHIIIGVLHLFSLSLSILMAFHISGFLMIAIWRPLPVTVCTIVAVRIRLESSSKTSGGWTPNGKKIMLTLHNVCKHMWNVNSMQRAREIVCLSIYFSLFCVLLCAWGHDLVAYFLCFDEWCYVYITMGTKLPTICPILL